MSELLFNPYPPHYRAAFASSSILFPHRHRQTLQSDVPEGERYGVSTFHLQEYIGLGACYRPEGVWVTKAYNENAVPTFIAVLAQA